MMTPHQFRVAVAKLVKERDEWREAALAAVDSLARIQGQVKQIRRRLEKRRVRLVLPKGPR